MDVRPLTTAEAAAELGLDPSQLRRLAREHGKGMKAGPVWLFTPAQIAWLKIHRPRVGKPRSRQEASAAV